MSVTESWQPFASPEVIKKRAVLYRRIRAFMHERHILEVDTPVLSHYGTTDPYIQSLCANSSTNSEKTFYLQTSPEFCMKRLLAAGSGSIYQIAHVFRDEEVGKQHMTEFSMLEWYRDGFDYHQLMDELADFLEYLGLNKPDKMTYAQAFKQTLKIDLDSALPEDLQKITASHGWNTASDDRHELLDFIFSSVVMRQLSQENPLIIYDYPECMAALATIRPGIPAVSERFELFISGMEIANGFNELADAKEQQERFESDLVKRKRSNMDEPPIDVNFITALKQGLPKSAGIAIGLDRLLMFLANKHDINEVTTFSLANN